LPFSPSPPLPTNTCATRDSNSPTLQRTLFFSFPPSFSYGSPIQVPLSFFSVNLRFSSVNPRSIFLADPFYRHKNFVFLYSMFQTPLSNYLARVSLGLRILSFRCRFAVASVMLLFISKFSFLPPFRVSFIPLKILTPSCFPSLNSASFSLIRTVGLCS